MNVEFDRSQSTINELDTHRADAEILIHLYDDATDDEPTVTIWAFMSVFWEVMLSGVRSVQNGSPIVYELDFGEFRIEPQDDRLRVEVHRQPETHEKILVDTQELAAALVSEAKAFVQFLSDNGVKFDGAAITEIENQVRETEEWYERQSDTDG